MNTKMKANYIAPMTDIMDLKCQGLLCFSLTGTRTDYGEPIPITFGDSMLGSPLDSPLDGPLF
jgi:hypothetical protein